MGLLTSLLRPSPAAMSAAPAAARDPADDFWYGPGVRRAAAGVAVTMDRARQVPVVRDCLQVLATSGAALATGVFERLADDSRTRAEGHAVARLLANPNPEQTSYEFMAQLIDDLASEGGFTGELKYGDLAAFPSEIARLNPRHTRLERLVDGSRRVVIREPGRPERKLVEGEFWYIPLPPLKDGLTGRSPILDDGREAIGAAIALQDFANGFFGNDATPPFVFKHKSHFDTNESKANFLNAWKRWFGGRNRGTPAVLEYDMAIEKLGVNNEEAQFLETRKELWNDVARLWRMTPHKVGLLDKATFSNIEHQALEFVTDTMVPFLELIERSVNKHLIADPRFYFEFNVSSLLRGDVKARYSAYAQGRQWGWLSVNEIRRLENMNGIGPAGDRYMEPLNMAPAGSAGEGRTGDDDAKDRKAIAFLRKSVVRGAAATGGQYGT